MENNGKRIISLESWKRRENWLFFSGFANPMVSLTCPVEAGGAYRRTKAQGKSFFLVYLHAILSAFNEIDELHYRVDPQGQIVRYDRIDAIAPVRIPGRDGFTTLRFTYRPDAGEFIDAAREVISNPGDASAYSAENSLTENDLILVSAVPCLAFTSADFTLRGSEGNPYPLILVGKLGDDGKMPIAISLHHGFVDGEHIGRFYSLVEHAMQ